MLEEVEQGLNTFGKHITRPKTFLAWAEAWLATVELVRDEFLGVLLPGLAHFGYQPGRLAARARANGGAR